MLLSKFLKFSEFAESTTNSAIKNKKVNQKIKKTIFYQVFKRKGGLPKKLERGKRIKFWERDFVFGTQT